MAWFLFCPKKNGDTGPRLEFILVFHPGWLGSDTVNREINMALKYVQEYRDGTLLIFRLSSRAMRNFSELYRRIGVFVAGSG